MRASCEELATDLIRTEHGGEFLVLGVRFCDLGIVYFRTLGAGFKVQGQAIFKSKAFESKPQGQTGLSLNAAPTQ